MNLAKIGIDLATKKTGICILKPNLCWVKVMELLPWKDFHTLTNIQKIDNFIKEIKELLKEDQIDIGIELSNFRNAQMTQRFSYYAGALCSAFYKYFPNQIQSIKMFNANSWQFLIGCAPNDEREYRKQLAREFAKENCLYYQENWTEDECDSYCIAHLLDQIITTNQLYENNQKKKSIKGSKRNALNLIQKKIISRLEKINSLDKIRNKKQINSLTQQLSDLYDQKNKIIEEVRLLNEKY